MWIEKIRKQLTELYPYEKLLSNCYRLECPFSCFSLDAPSNFLRLCPGLFLKLVELTSLSKASNKFYSSK